MKKELIDILEKLAFLLEIKGENPFKATAYINAAALLETLDIDLEKEVEEGTLGNIKGFGKALVEKITDYVKTGKMGYYERIKAEVPESLVEFKAVEGLGAKRIGIIWKELNITTLEELEIAAREHKLSTIKGISENLESKILESVEKVKSEGALKLKNEFRNIR